MSINKSTGAVDTAIEGVSNLTFPRRVVNFGADFRVKTSVPGKEVILTNITTPMDQPEKIRISFADVKNVFTGTGIEPSVQSPSKEGVSILAQLTDVIEVTDTANVDYKEHIPMSVQLVIKTAKSKHIGASEIVTAIGGLLSALFESGVTTTPRLEALLRGSIMPGDL